MGAFGTESMFVLEWRRWRRRRSRRFRQRTSFDLDPISEKELGGGGCVLNQVVYLIVKHGW